MYYCVSVPGGWQTCMASIDVDATLDRFVGPVFNDIKDLWEWQKNNL